MSDNAESVSATDLKRRIDSVRARLFDAASDLRPLATDDEFTLRIDRVAAELQRIHHDLLLVGHIQEIELGGLEDEVAEIDAKVAKGWRPPSRSAEDVVDDLKSQFA